ncbi:hypothetical protein UA08_03395 [Talaromyces atroroseus]|uniref:Transcription factor domain-containing protein n=1 Tax=Talaromyces atroroseus TaxID=1441469 RepID=A0A225B206_TALAT|nr:hypothetical protein UA08_03395 [Talaromyces atroroseus]OKL61256.1 hypothetical protein UA08_03395 [Talaromyces atroroseus]
MSDSTALLLPRISRSCDQCKARKVRCIPLSLTSRVKKRHQKCHYSHTKRKLKVKDPENTSPTFTHSPTDPADASPPSELPQKLYIDHILETRHAHGIEGWREESSVFKLSICEQAGESFIASASLAFFSESRIRSLTERVGHPRLRELIETIGSVINLKMNRKNNEQQAIPQRPPITFKSPEVPEKVSPEAAKASITAYFTHLHPIYPFLDRSEFEQKAFSYDLPHHLSSNAAFSALYHTVLALGFQYTEGGSFEAGKGKTWKLYQVALGLLSDILLPRESLVNLQELCDEDIGCPIPEIPEAIDGSVDWFLLSARFARLTSRAYQLLFTVSATSKTPRQFFDAIDSVHHDLEIWRLSIPKDQRPGEPFIPENYRSSWTITISLRSHLFYYAVVVSLCRLCLHIGAGSESPRVEHAKRRLMYTARQIIEITHYIEIQPHTPIWQVQISLSCMPTSSIRLLIPPRILGVMPLSALFILFDFVVHNPFHPETSTNLNSLDIAGVYFNRLEYATKGSLPCSLVAEFTFIARQFVREVQLNSSTRETSTKQKPYPGLMKPIEQVTGDPQSMAYMPSRMQAVVLPVQEQQEQSLDGSFQYVDQLFYPTDDLQPFMTGDFTAGFDMNNLFDSFLPNFQI